MEAGKEVKVYYDSDGVEFKTSSEKEIAFIEGLEDAMIPWRVYSGRCMFGRYCPSVYCGGDYFEGDVYEAVGNIRLRSDSLGRGTVLYTG